MRKLLGLVLASTLILGACGSSGDKKESNGAKTSVDETKVQFKNDTLVLDDAVLKIKDIFIVNDKDEKTKNIAFKYEVTNKSGSEDVDPNTVFMAGFTVNQGTDNSIAKLETGTALTTGKYKEWAKHAHDTVKKGKTAKGIIGYKLQNDNKVILKASQGIAGKELGEKEIDISKLKTVDYSMVEDTTKEMEKKSDNNTSNESNSSDKTASSNENKKVAVENKNANYQTTNNQQQVNNTPIQNNPNEPTRQQYENAKKFMQDFNANPDKYQGIGGGPGLMTEQGETYEQYKNRVVEQTTP